jgi:endonuclease/exonuclease/phosphatase (EEP) superfamily protein YafD
MDIEGLLLSKQKQLNLESATFLAPTLSEVSRIGPLIVSGDFNS